MRNLKSLTAVFAASLAATCTVWAQMIPPGQQAAALENLLSEQPLAASAQDPETGRLGRVYGNIPIEATSAYGAAIEFVERYANAFGVRASDLSLEKYSPIADKFVVYWFRQHAFGVPVDQAGVTVLVKPGSPHSVVLASPITVPTPTVPPNGLISHQYAWQVVRRLMPHADNILQPEFVIWSNGTIGRYAYKVEASTNDLANPERWFFFIDAVHANVLEQRDGIYYVDITGSIKGWGTPGAEPDASYNPPVLLDLPGQALVQGGNSAYADMQGLFTIPHPGTSAVNVDARLHSQWARAVNQAGSNEVLTLNITPPGPANFVFNSSPSQFVTAQVNALLHTTIVHNFAKAINPAYPGIDIQMPANVNINSSCNAFYNGTSINFFRAAGSCVNTAYSSVVYHEYGHHIVATGHNNPSGAFHEGFADITSMLLLDDPIIGRGFSGQGTYVRYPVNANVQYPCSGGSHHCGQVVGGAFWRLNVLLQAKLGWQEGIDHARYLYLNLILLSPAINPNMTIDVLTLDDDDGNIFNGTPNYDEIDQAFSAHNLPPPPLAIVTDLVINPASVIPGGSTQGTVRLRSGAPVGGAEVMLESGTPGVAQVPASVIVPHNATTATFPITTTPGSPPQQVEIRAIRLGSMKTANLEIVEPQVDSVSVNPIQVTGGSTALMTVRLSGAAPDGGVPVALWSSMPGVASVQPTVTVLGGQVEATVVVNTSPVVVTQDTYLFAEFPGTPARSVRFTVMTPVATGITVSPTTVAGGTGSTGTVTISGPAPTGGATVFLSTTSPSASVPSTVTVAAGQTTATFPITTVAVLNPTIAPIRASRWNTVTAPLAIMPAAITSFTITPTSVKGGKNATGRVTISAPAPIGYAVQVSCMSDKVTLPMSVNFAPGATQATFLIRTKKVNQNTPVTITVSRDTTELSAVLTILR